MKLTNVSIICFPDANVTNWTVTALCAIYALAIAGASPQVPTPMQPSAGSASVLATTASYDGEQLVSGYPTVPEPSEQLPPPYTSPSIALPRAPSYVPQPARSGSMPLSPLRQHKSTHVHAVPNSASQWAPSTSVNAALPPSAPNVSTHWPSAVTAAPSNEYGGPARGTHGQGDGLQDVPL